MERGTLTTPFSIVYIVNFEQVNAGSDIITKNPQVVLVTGNFNARSAKWWKNDQTTAEGVQIEPLISSYELTQVISEPMHILHCKKNEVFH